MRFESRLNSSFKLVCMEYSGTGYPDSVYIKIKMYYIQYEFINENCSTRVEVDTQIYRYGWTNVEMWYGNSANIDLYGACNHSRIVPDAIRLRENISSFSYDLDIGKLNESLYANFTKIDYCYCPVPQCTQASTCPYVSVRGDKNRLPEDADNESATQYILFIIIVISLYIAFCVIYSKISNSARVYPINP